MSNKNHLIINCGASHLSVAQFSTANQVELKSYETRSLNYDINDESQWVDEILSVFQSIQKQVSSLKGNARIVLPGHLLLTKSIKVPLVDASRQSQIIAFEAQQSIPYPLSEVEWGHQVISDDGVETEVLIAAVKSDLATKLCKGLQKMGVVPDFVSASSVLDYNAFKYSYPSQTEETLILNMGSRSANLIFANQSGFFIKSVGVGGNTLTQSIADSLGLNFAQAEAVKLEYLSNLLPEGDPRTAAIQTACEQFMASLSQQITRSILNYRQQKKRNGTKIAPFDW